LEFILKKTFKLFVSIYEPSAFTFTLNQVSGLPAHKHKLVLAGLILVSQRTAWYDHTKSEQHETQHCY